MQGAFQKLARTSSPARLSDELAPLHLGRSLSAAVLLYFLEIILVISFATLIFSGKLAGGLSPALSLLFAGDAVLVGLIALLSSYAGTIAVQQDTSAVMVAVIAATITARLPASASLAQQLATVVLLIVGTSVATGIFFLLLGTFKLGGLVRFVPYPVMGGFLAGTGWLLLVGGLGVMTRSSLSARMIQPTPLQHWLPALALGAVLLLATTRISHPAVLPGIAAGAGALFYLAAWVTHTPLSRLSAEGWLLGPFPASNPWQVPLRPALLSQVDWTVLLGQVPSMAPVLVVSVLALLLNISGLELVVKQDIDLNRELIVTGVGNIGCGVAGGLVGFHAISASRLNRAMGGRRLSGLLMGLLVGVTALAGVTALGNAPRLVFGALLVYLGLDFLWEWGYRAWFRFPRVDYLIVVSILAVIAVRGFLAGIAVGLVLTIILFVVEYSRIDVIRHTLSGLTYHSRFRRNPAQQEILDLYGDALHILTLHGFIFFGTANTLFERFQAHLSQADRPSVRFAVLDFAEVTGLDSTALLSFSKLLQLAQREGITVVLTALHGNVSAQLLQDDFAQHGNVRFFPDLDRGVEWGESQILAAHGVAEDDQRSLPEALAVLVPASLDVQRLIGYLRREQFGPGEHLIAQGATADTVYFVESGQISAYLERPGSEPVRLETMRGGRAVGELAFYLRIPRTAAVIADEPTTVYSLSRDQLTHLESSDPAAAEVFHHVMARLLADRVVHLMRTVEALEK